MNLGSLFTPLTDALGLTAAEQANLQQAKQVNQVSNPFGTTTKTGFTAAPNPNQGTVDAARAGLSSQVAQGFGADPQRLQEFQDAYQGARSPALERSLQQQQQQQNIQSATRGTAGSSSDLLREALQNQFANEQRGNLLNQAIQGREGLAANQFNQNLAGANFNNALVQQDFGNQLAGFGAGQQQLNQAQGNEFNVANQANQIEQARVDGINAHRNDAFNSLVGLGGTAIGLGNLGAFEGLGGAAAGGGGVTAFSGGFQSPNTGHVTQGGLGGFQLDPMFR